MTERKRDRKRETDCYRDREKDRERDKKRERGWVFRARNIQKMLVKSFIGCSTFVNCQKMGTSILDSVTYIQILYWSF